MSKYFFRVRPPMLVDVSCQTYVQMEEIGIQVPLDAKSLSSWASGGGWIPLAGLKQLVFIKTFFRQIVFFVVFKKNILFLSTRKTLPSLGKTSADAHASLHSLALLAIYLWGQFHQHFGAKLKCAGSHSLALVGAIEFHQQNYAPIHHYTTLENTLNFYPVCPTPCASKIGVNLLAQKLRLKCSWKLTPGLITNDLSLLLLSLYLFTTYFHWHCYF
jgi:hypothetical protein